MMKSRLIFYEYLGHWITIWGYNDKEKAFYVCGSYVPAGRHNKTNLIDIIKEHTKKSFETGESISVPMEECIPNH